MIKEKIYTYLGVNGTITSPVLLEGVYHINKYRLTAEDGFVLTNGKKQEKKVIVPELELSQWREIAE